MLVNFEYFSIISQSVATTGGQIYNENILFITQQAGMGPGGMIGLQMSSVQSHGEKWRENNHITRTPIIKPRGESFLACDA